MGYLKPSEIQDQYFKFLKSIKPSINIFDNTSDFVIRGKVFSGVVSGVYGDQKKVDNDSFVSSMRPESLELKGADYGIERQQPTKSRSANIQISGTDGTVVNVGALGFIYIGTGFTYTNSTSGTIAGGVLTVSIEADAAGSVGNIPAGESLKIISPPSGVNQSASIVSAISDGSDIESIDSYRARILSKLQSTPSGGNETDYPLFAFMADDSVRSAFIKRFGRGLGTVDIYITTGTTDIDSAITNGGVISRIPSGTLIDTVQAYYESHAPLTDMPRVLAPTEVSLDVNINVVLDSGLTLASVPSDPLYNPENLTVLDLVKREVERVLYKQSVGGRKIGSSTNGFVVAADIEESIDTWLSSVKDPITGIYQGKIPILSDRQVLKLDGANWNKALAENQLVTPGTITVSLGV